MADGSSIKARATDHRAAFFVSDREIEAPNAGERNRGGAHRAGFERDVQITVRQPLTANLRSRFANDQHFGMSRGIIGFARAVPVCCNNLAARDVLVVTAALPVAVQKDEQRVFLGRVDRPKTNPIRFALIVGLVHSKWQWNRDTIDVVRPRLDTGGYVLPHEEEGFLATL